MTIFTQYVTLLLQAGYKLLISSQITSEMEQNLDIIWQLTQSIFKLLTDLMSKLR